MSQLPYTLDPISFINAVVMANNVWRPSHETLVRVAYVGLRSPSTKGGEPSLDHDSERYCQLSLQSDDTLLEILDNLVKTELEMGQIYQDVTYSFYFLRHGIIVPNNTIFFGLSDWQVIAQTFEFQGGLTSPLTPHLKKGGLKGGEAPLEELIDWILKLERTLLSQAFHDCCLDRYWLLIQLQSQLKPPRNFVGTSPSILATERAGDVCTYTLPIFAMEEEEASPPSISHLEEGGHGGTLSPLGRVMGGRSSPTSRLRPSVSRSETSRNGNFSRAFIPPHLLIVDSSHSPPNQPMLIGTL
jgi:hypothetical protein